MKKTYRSALVYLGLVLLGGLLVSSPFVIYFTNRAALESLWDAAFRYNFGYVMQMPFSYRLDALKDGIQALSASGLSLVALVAWIVLCLTRGSSLPTASRGVLGIVVLDLPTEMVLSALSGRSYSHYWVPWLPSMGVLTAWCLGTWVPRADTTAGSGRSVKPHKGWPWGLVTLVVSSLVPMWHWALLTQRALSPPDTKQQAIAYVLAETDPEDAVLLWGAETSMNFMTEREAPSRFAYLYPLLTEGYRDTGVVREFLNDIVSRQPAMIIDTSGTNRDVPPLDSFRRGSWTSPRVGYASSAAMEEVYAHIADKYVLETSLHDGKWDVYRFSGNRR